MANGVPSVGLKNCGFSRLLSIVVAVSLAGTVGSLSSNVRESIFRPGIVYKFDYSGDMLVGVPTLNPDESTQLAVRAVCSLAAFSNNIYVLRLQNIEFSHKFNKVAPSEGRQPRQSPDHVSSDGVLSNEQTAVLAQWLSKPIKFSYESGDIGEIWTERTDEYWSVNVKKGLLSLLQVNLNQRNSVVGPSDHQTAVTSSRRRTLQPTYSVSESDVTGECEVKYVINTVNSGSSPSSTSYHSTRPRFLTPSPAAAVSTMYVTKTRNFQSCSGPQSFVNGLPQFLATKASVFDRLVTTDYVITGDRHHFLVHSAKLSAQYQLAPFGSRGGYISTRITQTLELNSTRDMERLSSFASPETEFVRDRRGLEIDIPSMELIPDSRTGGARDAGQQQAQQTQYKQLVDGKLSALIDSLYPTVSDSATRQVLELHHILRRMTHRQLYDVITSYNVSSSPSSLSAADRLAAKKRDVLLSILPSIMSVEVVDLLASLIKSGQLTGLRAVAAVAQSSLTVRPTPDVALTLTRLHAELRRIRGQDAMTRQAVLLAAGTVTNRMIAAMHRKTNERILSTHDTIVAEFRKLFDEASSDSERLEVVEALSNIGSRSAVLVLKSIAEDASLSNTVRVNGVLSMRKMAKTAKLLVHPMLLSLFVDRRTPVELRSAAALLLLRSHPSLPHLRLLAHSVDTEPAASDDLRCLVYSNIVSLARRKSSLVELQQVSNNARFILRLMKPVAVYRNNSQSSLLSYFSDDRGVGLTLKVDHLRSALASAFPDLLNSFSLVTDLFGDHVQLAQFSFGGNFESLAAGLGSWPLGGLFRDVMTGQQSQWAAIGQLVSELTNADLDQFWNKVRDVFSRDTREAGGDDVLASGFWRLLVLDHVVMSAAGPLQHGNVQQIVNTIKERVSAIIPHLVAGYDVDSTHLTSLGSNTLILATPLGVTLTLNISAVSTAKVDGKVKINNLPPISQLISGQTAISDVHLTVQLQPSVSVLFLANVGVDMRWLATGSAFKASLNVDVPVDFDITINPRNVTGINIRYNFPKQDMRIAKLTAMPFNFLHLYPATADSRQPFQTRFAPITDKRTPDGFNLQKRWKIDRLGLEFLLNASKGYDASLIVKTSAATASDVFMQTRRSDIADVTRTGDKYDTTLSTYKQQSTTASRRSSGLRSSWSFLPVPLDASMDGGLGPVRRTRYLADFGVTSSTLLTSQLTLFRGAAGSQLNFQALRLDNTADRKQVTVNAVLTASDQQSPSAARQTTALLRLNASWTSTVAHKNFFNVQVNRADQSEWMNAFRSVDEPMFWWQRMWLDTSSHAAAGNATQDALVYVFRFNTSLAGSRTFVSILRETMRHSRWDKYHTTLDTDEQAQQQIGDNDDNVSTLTCRIEPAYNTMSLLLKTDRESDTLTNVPMDAVYSLLVTALTSHH